MRFDATTPPQGTLRDWIDARADRGGTAFVFPETGETLTWPELRDHCAIVAGDLTAQGIAKGESIAVMHPNGYDGVKALFSALYGSELVEDTSAFAQLDQPPRCPARWIE